jgi:hypothetical protein
MGFRARSSGDRLRSGLIISGLAALAIAGGGAVAQAAATGLDLPMPVNTTIAVPASSLVPLADDSKAVEFSPTIHLNVAQAGFAAAPLQFGPSFAVRAAASPLVMDVPQSRAAAAALDWDFFRWGGLGLIAADSTRTPGLLGDYTPTPLSLADDTKTAAAGLSAHVKFGDGWVTSFAYSMDITQLDLKAGASPVLATSSVHGQSYGVSIAKHGLFGDADALGLSVSRPSENYFGSVSLADVGLEGRVNLSDSYRGIALSNQAQETDIALGYVTSFFKGALTLQANAGYQMNVAGQSGANSLTVLSRAKINF